MLLATAAARRRDLVLGDLLPGALARDVLVVVGFAGLVGLFAQLAFRLPFTPVPITGQTFAVLLGGMAVGPRRAAAGMSLYLVVGLAGVPWFAQGSGGLALLGAPSFGYIVGFLVAATGIGYLAAHRIDRHPLSVLAAMVAGNFVIYLFGATWLAVDLHLGAGQAIALGVAPFLIGDAIKAVAAMGLLPGTWRLVGNVPA
ncbi:MAG: biotin transporter BioY [Candidatus Dormibacteria bacterium]